MTKVILLLLCYRLLYADIDAEIEAIQNASVEERFKLMNAFKHKLIKMRQKERIGAINKLKTIIENPPKDIQEKIKHEIENETEQEIENHAQKEDDD